MATKNRILSIDVLRGITIAGMILVNNPGSWSAMYTPLTHASWHGLTPTDLIFPFFMFIMGISTYISLKKYQFTWSKDAAYKIVKRTILIILIGYGIGWLSLSFRTYHGLADQGLSEFERLLKAITNFGHIRIPGVMQRLGICYGAAAAIALSVKHNKIPYIIGGTLIGYFLLLSFGNGFEISEENIIARIDKALFGINHLYTIQGVHLDPEGLLSSLPSIAHVLIGLLCGKALLETQKNEDRILKLFLIGTLLTFAGFLLQYGCPINKKIWTPTFVLVTCGMGASFLAILTWVIDVKGIRKPFVFFESFGVNPLFMYVLGGFLAIVLGGIWLPINGDMISIRNIYYLSILKPYFTPKTASLLFAISFLIINWFIGHILYKKQIYIKI